MNITDERKNEMKNNVYKIPYIRGKHVIMPTTDEVLES
jgi:hypothetical protein